MRRQTPAASLLCLLLLAANFDVLGAQRISDARVAVGTPIRVRLINGGEQRAFFAGETSDALEVRYACGAGCDRRFALPWGEVGRVDARVSDQRSARRALAYGLAGGASAFALWWGVYRITRRSEGRCVELDCPDVGVAIVAPYVISAGALVGLVYGWSHPAQTWRAVWPGPQTGG